MVLGLGELLLTALVVGGLTFGAYHSGFDHERAASSNRAKRERGEPLSEYERLRETRLGSALIAFFWLSLVCYGAALAATLLPAP